MTEASLLSFDPEGLVWPFYSKGQSSNLPFETFWKVEQLLIGILFKSKVAMRKVGEFL